jgi:hypothetical protein
MVPLARHLERQSFAQAPQADDQKTWGHVARTGLQERVRDGQNLSAAGVEWTLKISRRKAPTRCASISRSRSSSAWYGSAI